MRRSRASLIASRGFDFPVARMLPWSRLIQSKTKFLFFCVAGSSLCFILDRVLLWFLFSFGCGTRIALFFWKNTTAKFWLSRNRSILRMSSSTTMGR